MTGFGETATRVFGSISDTTRSFAASAGSSYLLPIIGTVVLIVVIAIAIYYGIQANTKRPAKELLGPVDLFTPSSPVILDRNTITKSMMNSYTLSIYFQIDAVPDMRNAATPLLVWPSVWDLSYDATKEQLIWNFTQTNDGKKAVTAGPIPLQRWNQVVLTFEGRTADMYCNGVLLASTTLDNITPLPTSSITIVPKYVMGRVAYIQAWSRRLPMREVAENYVATSDSQGRPYLTPDFLKALQVPNIFCPGGQCTGTDVPSGNALKWEFPYQ